MFGSKIRTIAIDGPVAAGKTVVGQELARHLGFTCLDTGMMYRAITWLALRSHIGMDNELALSTLAANTSLRFNEQDYQQIHVGNNTVGLGLRKPDVDKHVSLVARLPQVRRALVKQQRALAKEGDIVMIGRDIGTVVLPDADLKIYMQASAEERAKRRWLEFHARDIELDLQQVLRDIKARDNLDSCRTDSPLMPAKDAILMNTEGRSIKQIVQLIFQQIPQLAPAPER
jgi:cytidylate kinase